MTDLNDLTGYHMVAASEASDSVGIIGYKVFVLRDKKTQALLDAIPDKSIGGPLTPYEREHGLFYGIGRDIQKILLTQRYRLDPETSVRVEKQRAVFQKCFEDAGLGPIFMERIENGYVGAFPEAVLSPWFRVTTRFGHIDIGWRSSVIHIDWKDTALRRPERIDADGLLRPAHVPSGEFLFPDENVTRWASGIHAYGYEKVTQYLKRLVTYTEE